MALTQAGITGYVRQALTPEENQRIGSTDITNITDMGLQELGRILGGEVTSSDVAVDASGFAALPALTIRIFRVEYGGVRMSRISYDEFAELVESS